MKAFLAIALAALAVGCATPPAASSDPPTPEGQRKLGIFANLFYGTFDSIDHSRGPGKGTRLRLARLWLDRAPKGEYWFYAEYVRSEADGAPFRQRIYRFTEAGGKMGGEAYRLPGDPASFAGEWRKPRPFDAVQPGQLERFEGCRLTLIQAHMSIYSATTDGTACRGDRPGVAYERSEFHLTPSSLRNGELAYDAAGKAVGEAGFWDFRKTSRELR